jgi:hypothetical protein
MLLDILLLIVLVTCIAYCIILTRRINELNNNKNNLTKMLSKFDESIIKAESSIATLNTASSNAIKNLSDLVKNGETLSNDLKLINEVSNKIADRLESNINISKKLEKDTPKTHVEKDTAHSDKNVAHENKISHNVSQIFSPADTLGNKKTIDHNEYFSSLKKISTKNES